MFALTLVFIGLAALTCSQFCGRNKSFESVAFIGGVILALGGTMSLMLGMTILAVQFLLFL